MVSGENIQSILQLNAMQYSWLPQERRQLRIREKPPLVISLQRYGRLQANACQAGREEQRQRQQQRQLDEEQLRRGGEELLRQFAGRKLCRTEQEQCTLDQRQQQAEQLAAKQRALEESHAAGREQQETQRRRIEKAQQLLEQLRPGPRELNCARLQSEVLRGINVQRQLQAQYAAATAEQRSRERSIYSAQVHRGLEEAQLEQRERHQQLGAHKRELLASIEQRRRERSAAKAQQLEEARQERQRNQRQIQQQLEKEQVEQANRLRQRRTQALESMADAEQRRQQLQLLDRVEQAMCDVHNEAKAKLDGLKIDRAQQRVQRRLQRNEQLAKELAPRLHYSAGEDQLRHERQLAEMRRAHSVDQQISRQRRDLVKAERLAMQKSEQQQAEAAKQRAEEERSEAVARRLENKLIHVQFKRQQRQEQLRRQHELRSQLDKQEQLRRETEARPGTNYNRLAQLECLREDDFFVDYAHRLMTEARAKGCPLKPFVRAVELYKNENRIGVDIRIPRHLITKLNMGRRTRGDSSADRLAKEQQEQSPSEEEVYKKKIAENLKKIEALVLAEGKQEDRTN